MNCELPKYNEMPRCDHRSYKDYRNCEVARKKVFRGFNGIRTRGLCVHAAVLYHLSYEDPYTESRPIYWVHKPRKEWSTEWNYVNCGNTNEMKMCPLNRKFKHLRSCPKKRFSGLQRDLNPWPLRSRSSALPAELWRPIHGDAQMLLQNWPIFGDYINAELEEITQLFFFLILIYHPCKGSSSLNDSFMWYRLNQSSVKHCI